MDVHVMADRAWRAGQQRSVITAASSARLRVRDKVVAIVHGSLPITGGVVVLSDGGTVAQARLDLDVQGIDTGNRRRDRDLQKRRFLSAATSPSVTVDVRGVTSTGTGWTATAVVHACGRSAPLDLSVQPLVVYGALADRRTTRSGSASPAAGPDPPRDQGSTWRHREVRRRRGEPLAVVLVLVVLVVPVVLVVLIGCLPGGSADVRLVPSRHGRPPMPGSNRS